jgi:tetratricopeptide (TPR) repeat protein
VNPRVSGEAYVRLVWLGRAFILAVVSAAVVTHSLRDARDSQLEAGRALVEQRAYQAALEVLARAEPWPSTTKPGRIDYVRAEAYAGMGDRRRAEASYLRACLADRTYFWAVADLTLFYASSDEPAAERRRLVAPYLNRLRGEFAGHPALPKVLARVERQLAATRSGAAPDSPATLDGPSPTPPRSDG